MNFQKMDKKIKANKINFFLIFVSEVGGSTFLFLEWTFSGDVFVSLICIVMLFVVKINWYYSFGYRLITNKNQDRK